MRHINLSKIDCYLLTYGTLRELNTPPTPFTNTIAIATPKGLYHSPGLTGLSESFSKEDTLFFFVLALWENKFKFYAKVFLMY